MQLQHDGALQSASGHPSGGPQKSQMLHMPSGVFQAVFAQGSPACQTQHMASCTPKRQQYCPVRFRFGFFRLQIDKKLYTKIFCTHN